MTEQRRLYFRVTALAYWLQTEVTGIDTPIFGASS